MIQDLAEELQVIEQESLNDSPYSEVTQESDLEQISETSLTEDEWQWLAKTKTLSTKIFENYEPIKYYKDIETAHCQSENLDKYGIDHTEEVIIGSEQGTTFPTFS